MCQKFSSVQALIVFEKMPSFTTTSDETRSMSLKKRRGSRSFISERFEEDTISSEVSNNYSSTTPSPLSQTVQEFENLRSILFYGAFPGIVISIIAVFRLYTIYGIISLWTSSFSVCIFGIFCSLFYLFIRLDSVLSGLAKPCYEILEYKSSTETLNKTVIENANEDTKKRNELILKLKPLDDPPTLRPWDHKLVKSLFNREKNNSIDNQNYILIVRFSDRLGNNIFQYVYVRVLAEILQLPFLCPTKLSAPFDSLDLCVMPSFFNTKEKQVTKVIHHKSTLSIDTTFFISSITFLSTPVSNYAMNTQLYSHSLLVYIVNSWLWPSVLLWRKKIKSLKKENENEISCSYSNPNPDIVIHVRLGDILWGHHAAYRPLPISFYLTSLDTIFDRKQESKSNNISTKSEINKHDMYTIVLVTDDPNHIIIEKMKIILCSYLQGDSSYSHGHRGTSFGQYPNCVINVQSLSIATDFNTLLTAKDGLILSVSSFSWWSAAMLHWLIRKNDDDDDNDDNEQVYKKTKATMSSKGLKMSINKNEAYNKPSLFKSSFHESLYPTLIVPRYGLFLKQKWTPAPRLLPTIVNVDHCLSLTLQNETLETLEGSSSTKVIDIELSSLNRWEGNTKSAIEKLFIT